MCQSSLATYWILFLFFSTDNLVCLLMDLQQRNKQHNHHPGRMFEIIGMEYYFVVYIAQDLMVCSARGLFHYVFSGARTYKMTICG
jgi:hypothetical protein